MTVKIDPSWGAALNEEFNQHYFTDLVEFVRKEYQTGTIYPPGKDIFAAFDHCPFDRVKVMVIGQDPYHGPGQANGLCFSVAPGIRIPPSLQNIFKELHSDVGRTIPESGDLTRWADQGILLLNATLTVRAHTPGSHQKKGWETFTDRVIQLVSDKKDKIVFILWGAFAQKKEVLIDASRHFIIKSPHPSPFSADKGFYGSQPFSKTNKYLRSAGIKEIMW